ncbi:hypothetical protein MHPYR_100134 [uncultured Mycobacterium sp.]|uniref:Uncharacterized protein n=1 Tax=uncultured Mycobacterium sp. TaxID=171292 RepID=A0A1Y5P5J5_9MYCO|nr:hypothetical protein MHPYR_100134 [uncultured Mycobacterium sp.]
MPRGYRGRGRAGGGRQRGRQRTIRVHRDRRTGQRGRTPVRAGQVHRRPGVGVGGGGRERRRAGACPLDPRRRGDVARPRPADPAGSTRLNQARLTGVAPQTYRDTFRGRLVS